MITKYAKNLSKIVSFNFQIKNAFSQVLNQRAAVILSGCGVADGSEICETVSVMIALGQNNIPYQCFAPNKEQKEVVNHLIFQAQANQTRNVMEEAARITRGQIQNLDQLQVSDFQALVLPGGFGVAKNLSNFASQGSNFTVDTQVSNIINQFYKSKKPIAACCISPLILSKVLTNQQIEITLGKNQLGWPYKGTIELAQSFGNKLYQKDVDELCIDITNKIVTTPAFMKESPKFSEVFDGISKMISQLKSFML